MLGWVELESISWGGLFVRTMNWKVRSQAYLQREMLAHADSWPKKWKLIPYAHHLPEDPLSFSLEAPRSSTHSRSLILS